jgi:hypothetical protein
MENSSIVLRAKNVLGHILGDFSQTHLAALDILEVSTFWLWVIWIWA